MKKAFLIVLSLATVHTSFSATEAARPAEVEPDWTSIDMTPLSALNPREYVEFFYFRVDTFETRDPADLCYKYYRLGRPVSTEKQVRAYRNAEHHITRLRDLEGVELDGVRVVAFQLVNDQGPWLYALVSITHGGRAITDHHDASMLFVRDDQGCLVKLTKARFIELLTGLLGPAEMEDLANPTTLQQISNGLGGVAISVGFFFDALKMTLWTL